MTIAALLIVKLLPLYALILLGFIAGSVLHVKKESVSALLIYIIAPVVVLNGVLTTPLDASTLSLPILFLALGSVLCAVFYGIASLFWQTTEKNILSFAAGTGNTGYFGLSVVLALYGSPYLGTAVLLILGVILFENSIGYFVAARGHHSAREALLKLIKLPSLYAFILGVLLHGSSTPILASINDIFIQFRGAYTVLGMMLIGIGLASVTRSALDPLFTSMAFGAKFIAWPLCTFLIILLDRYTLHLYQPSVEKIILLLSTVPLASNTVAFATQLNTHPEKTAVAVLFSTLFAVVYMPLVIAVLFPLLG